MASAETSDPDDMGAASDDASDAYSDVEDEDEPLADFLDALAREDVEDEAAEEVDDQPQAPQRQVRYFMHACCRIPCSSLGNSQVIPSDKAAAIEGATASKATADRIVITIGAMVHKVRQFYS